MSDVLTDQPENFVLVTGSEVDDLLAKIRAADCTPERREALIQVLADTCKAEMEFNAQSSKEDAALTEELVSYALRTINPRNPIARQQDIALLGKLRKRFRFFVASQEVPRS